MNNRGRQIIVVTVLLLTLGSYTRLCARPAKIYPGKNNVAEAIAALQGRSEKITAIRANGICNIKFFDSAGKKNKQSFPVRIWAKSPRQICLHADIIFNPSAIIAGANENEFWLSSTLMKYYAWGQFNEDSSITFIKNVPPMLLSFSPQLLFDAMGLMKIENSSKWTLQNIGSLDILEKSTADGRMMKRIYINTNNYTIKAMQYFNHSGKITAVIEFDNYKIIDKKLTAPHKIVIVQNNADGVFASVALKLSKIKLTKLSDRQRQALFNKPKTDGFEHIMKVTE